MAPGDGSMTGAAVVAEKDLVALPDDMSFATAAALGSGAARDIMTER